MSSKVVPPIYPTYHFDTIGFLVFKLIQKEMQPLSDN